MSRLTNALKTCNELVKGGMDYSDAEFKASEKHRVAADKLRKAYDNQTREQFQAPPYKMTLPEYNPKEWDSYMQYACFYNID